MFLWIYLAKKSQMTQKYQILDQIGVFCVYLGTPYGNFLNKKALLLRKIYPWKMVQFKRGKNAKNPTL